MNLSQFPIIVEATINGIVSASAHPVLSIAIAICAKGISSSRIRISLPVKLNFSFFRIKKEKKSQENMYRHGVRIGESCCESDFKPPKCC